jgi:asparagine synthase (glutamine-hydrolysing)
MCGIVGLCLRRPLENPEILLAMRDSMVHRGPDDAGVWWSPDRRIGLAHRRLSIIDLSSTGHQPMTDNMGQYVVVFNGEIYNYRELQDELIKLGHVFRSSSDTEVLIEAYKEWGKDCLERLTGAFGFAIYDQNKRELFLARDRAGEKPLFYTDVGDSFMFSSELKALMANPFFSRELDPEALDCYLAYGHVSGPQSIFKNTYKLLPGHALLYRVDDGRIETWCYWDLPISQPETEGSIEEFAVELESLLCDSVGKQLVADVPVGVLLSGGLDSSLITALAARVSNQPIKTFTVSFPGHGSFDEGPYAKLVADYYGTDHTELVAEDTSVSILPILAKQFDEPLADHSIVPTSLLSNLVSGSVKVALGGDGGDELFGGYPHYNYVQKLSNLRRIVPVPVRKVVSLFGAYGLPIGTRGRNHLIGFSGHDGCSISAINLFFDVRFRRKLLSPLYLKGYKLSTSAEMLRASLFHCSLSTFQNAAKSDFKTIMTDAYLVKSDRASMLHSLELRAPFLDRKIIEFAFGRLPDVFRATSTGRKILLKTLAKRLLPPELDINRKQGFTLPLNAWFKGEWGRFMTDVLMGAEGGVFDKKIILKLIEGQRRGFANANRLFALTMFELWRREYKICA